MRHSTRGTTSAKGAARPIRVTAALVCMALCATMAFAACGGAQDDADGTASEAASATAQAAAGGSGEPAEATASASDPGRTGIDRIVDSMSVEELSGQLVLATLNPAQPPTDVQSLIAEQHMGGVLYDGNSQMSVDDLASLSATLQSYATGEARLFICADQEGGSVQHLKGAGFDAMPSAVVQGQMNVIELQSNAVTWGGQLSAAGVNVDFAPVADTLTMDRASNDAIGRWNRDFGLDAAGNGDHAAAVVRGLQSVGVIAAPKHFPGLGSMASNTDNTAEGVTDTTTTFDGPTIEAFRYALASNPGMVMVSVGTYSQLDPDNPAVFSRTIITDFLRGELGYSGVVTSDSLSAGALTAYPVSERGVRFIEAGGDLMCANSGGYSAQILEGIVTRANSDPEFAAKVKDSARRVLTLKHRYGLA